ncbi:hypothetical protein ACLB2K_054203 [Fragaria x ananassa]
MEAEFVLTFAAEGILTKVSSLAAQELALAWGFKAELEKLGESVSSIQDFLRGAAERPDDQGKAVEKWVKKLKQVAEDADDILDDFNYELLRRKVELHNHMKRKVLNFLSASNPLLFRLKMAHKIKKINDSLVVLKSQAAFINLVAKKGDSRKRPDREQTDSVFEIENGEKEKVVGREDAVRKIVTTLISSDNQQKDLSVMAIVGMAGLGKTTLAKSVYNESAIKTHFPKRIWVCVSNTFEVDTILSQMVESLTKTAGMKSRDVLLQVLTEELTGKRYVLVLDDVWNEVREKWEKWDKWDSLMSCLSKLNSDPGSCIIVTTRSTKVSTITATLPRHELSNLSKEECWSIIKQRALNLDENGFIDAELERIGREIAVKCGGVPLVAKVLGSLLRSKASEVAARASTVAEWSSIRDNRLWDLPEGEDRIMKVLKLSFDNLEPSPLKQCFAYCSMLRKDFEIQRDNLIQLWMAQGLLQTSTVENHHEMEETGKEYFNILLNNSLIQKVIEGGTITKYTMHDLVHDLAEKVSESERLTQELNDDVRHVARSRPPSTLENMSEVTVGRLRSLFSNDQVPENIFSKFKAMRVLSLDTANIKELPNSFGKLKHLRYLGLSDTGITALPKSIGKLYNLQTLRMLRNWRLTKLPREMQNLINLRHLVLTGCSECGELPILGHLPFLRDVEIHDMDNLKRFGSEIYGYDLVYEAAREKETIVLFPALKTLTIWICRELIEWMEAPTTTTTKVEVFPCLEELKILCCPRIGFIPIPYSMASLRELRIDMCNALSSIGQLDHCTALQELKINGCNALSSIGLEGLSSLRELRIGSCDALSSIGLEGLSSLRELRIGSCDALSSIGQLDHCTSLQKLRIDRCNALSSIGLEGLSSLRELRIGSCDALSSIGQLDHCTSLQELEIYSCDALSSIGLEGLSSLRKLLVGYCHYLSCLAVPEYCQELSVIGCPKLASITFSTDLNPCLEDLCIENCNGLQSLPDFRSFTSLRALSIEESAGIESLVSEFHIPVSLEQLWISEFRNLESIPRLEECTSLRGFGVSHCDKLKFLPTGLSCLARLEDLRLGPFWEDLDSFPDFQVPSQQLVSLRLIGWPKLKSLPQKVQHLTSLTRLDISSFKGVETLPEWLGNLASLVELRIWECENLKYLPSLEAMQRLTKLQRLEVTGCPLLEERCTKDSGEEWPKISHIPCIEIP